MRKLLLLVGIFWISCAALAVDEIKIVASSSVWTDLLSKMVEPFYEKYQIRLIPTNDVKIVSPAPEMLKGLFDGQGEASTAAITFDEWQKSYEKKFGTHELMSKITSRVIGRDLIRIVMNKSNGVKKLSFAQIEGLFTGKFKNWSQVGGADLPVKILLQEGTVARDTAFKKKIMPNEEFSADAKRILDYKEIFVYIKKTPGAVTFQPDLKVTTDEVAVPETDEIGRPITLATIGRPSENVIKLIQFIDKEGAKIMEEEKRKLMKKAQ